MSLYDEHGNLIDEVEWDEDSEDEDEDESPWETDADEDGGLVTV